MAVQGIVSFSYDPDQHLTVSSSWCQDLITLKPSLEHLHVRTVMNSQSSDNTVPIPNYQAAMDVWSGQGFSGKVGAVLPLDFDRYNFVGSCPNDPLGYQGNPLLNAYINDWSFRAENFAAQLASHGLTTYWVWNEPNLDALINPGDNCPPSSPHPEALSPQVYAAMIYQGCTRIKAGAQQAGKTAITYAGSLSILPGTDPNGPYGAQYLDRMYQTLNGAGVHSPYPWDALSINMTGIPDSSFISSVKSAIQGVQQKYGDSSPIVIGEWGCRNSEYDATRLRAAYDALRQTFPTGMYFFQHPAIIQHNTSDYGVRDWNTAGGQYTLGNTLLLYGVLQNYYQTP